jgi:hypothetical protein
MGGIRSLRRRRAPSLAAVFAMQTLGTVAALARLAWWTSFVSLTSLASVASVASAAPAEGSPLPVSPGPHTDEDLAAARQLFADAVADQDAGRYDTALEKFRRVQAVRDTANVRYRMAACLEALGRRAEALTHYTAAVRLGEGSKVSVDAVRASSERAAQLEQVVPRLSVVLPASAPAETRVRIDNEPVDTSELVHPIPLDSGPHAITADAPGMRPYRTGVTLPEGGSVTLTIALEPEAPPEKTGSAPPPAPPPAPAPDNRLVWAYGSFGLAGALAIGSVVSLLMRNANLNTLQHDCKTSGMQGLLTCPSSRQNEVNGARDAALLEGPLGIALGAGAAVAAGVGAFMLLTQPPPLAPGIGVAPVLSRSGGMLLVNGPLPQ